jgi:hypothetical protein
MDRALWSSSISLSTSTVRKTNWERSIDARRGSGGDVFTLAVYSRQHRRNSSLVDAKGDFFTRSCPFNAPEEIKLDYQEAIRCRFVNAYNATIEMCGRSLESSCIQLGANPKLVLNDMIKWVHSQGKITTPLSEMAHKVKLGRNRAAHPNPSDRTLTSEDADAVLEFTREYFQHVYVMPAKMATFDFDKGKNKP